MNQLHLYAHSDLCIGCQACEVACKQENDLPVGVEHIKVVKVGPYRTGAKLAMSFISMYCRHCSKPPCVPACPLGAIAKRSDGLVLIDEDRCIGCTVCLETCPFGAIELDPRTQLATKCTLCAHRVDAGLLPACAQHCPTGALAFTPGGELKAAVGERRERAAGSRVSSFETGLTSADDHLAGDRNLAWGAR